MELRHQESQKVYWFKEFKLSDTSSSISSIKTPNQSNLNPRKALNLFLLIFCSVFVRADLNQQKSSEQQSPEEVKETPHVAGKNTFM